MLFLKVSVVFTRFIFFFVKLSTYDLTLGYTCPFLINLVKYSILNFVTISGYVTFEHISYGIPTSSIESVGSAVITDLIDLSTRLPIISNLNLPPLPLNLTFKDFNGLPPFLWTDCSLNALLSINV